MPDKEKMLIYFCFPQLLPNLEYNPKIMVHTIMNGKNIMNYRKWNNNDFLEKASSYRE